MENITIEALVNAGAHFGHPTSKWNPNFKPYIAMKKNGIHIIDLEQTQRQLEKACKEITRLVRDNGTILFVGTKKQAKDVIQMAADRCSMFYVVERWLGGTLTNFATIKKSIKRLLLLEKESSEIYSNLTKKEMGLLERERIKLGDLHRGIKDMKYLPSAIFFVDGMNESTAIKEATRLGIPTFGIVDSNTDPTPIDFPIPANDDSLKSIHFIVNHIADVIIEARGGVVDDGKGSIEKEIESYAAELNAAQSDDEVDSLDIDETDLASLNEPEDEPASEDKETN